MKAKNVFLDSLKKELEERKNQHLLRILRPFESHSIDFSSNDYLGLNFDGLLTNFLKKIIEDYKEFTVGSTGSRLISGHRKIFEELEEDFARDLNVESSLLFHSGYVANVSTIYCLLSPRDFAFVDRLCHASILDGIRISGARRIYFNHNDMNHLIEMIKKTQRTTKSFFWIFTESIFSMDGDSPPLEDLIKIAKEYDCNLFIDEAHSIGIVGERGKGLVYSHQYQNEFTVITYPLGKAPGLMGCFVVGENILKEYLINHARGFIYSTAQPIILIMLLKKIWEYLKTEEAEKRRNKVKSLSTYTREKLLQHGFDIGNSNSHIIPIIFKEEALVLSITEELRKKHYSIIGIRPPTVPKNTSRIRLNLHAHNSFTEIDTFIEDLISISQKLKVKI